ncbi:MAG: Tex family protein [Bacillota bacterium]|nr:Tex family protein [Bacillota bacterium]
MNYAKAIAEAFSVKEEYVANIITLLDEGNTIPFIARYRKEMHGTMDDQKIREISDKLTYLRNLDARREEVRNLIAQQEKLTEEISASLDKAATLAEIEDIYRPFRPKRKTRASVAKAKGLQPLADEILMKQKSNLIPLEMAEKYIDEEKGVETAEEALQGALDIIAETVSDNAEVRRRVRNIVFRNALLSSAAAKDESSVYDMYYEFSQPVCKIADHRVLAVNRGEKEGFLKVSLDIDGALPLNAINNLYVQSNTPCGEAVKAACEDSYGRLIFPSIEREIRSDITDTASTAAIKLFGVNLRQLLLQPPVKGKVAIGLDPGYRTGCKLAVVDATGKVLDTSVIYPTHGEAQAARSRQVLKSMITRYGVEIIAIGNGTASKETEMFTAETLKEMNSKAAYMVVSEAGASVYSASKLAAQEMPDFDLTLRSAVSIARRLQDPLAELVKIEPKAIGVGQYQHDMPQKQLEEALDGVVEECVNSVGADLNTASPSLLSHISGLSSAVCKNIVAYREENGSFSSRAELKKVPKLGPKAFEQCAGFLRVPGSRNPLDNTGVHPESYAAANEILKRCGISPKELGKVPVSVGNLEELAAELGVGVPTLQDIVKELSKPGRDMRDELPPPMLRTDVLDMKDLKEGMVLKGTVRNVIDFGAFVDIGVHQDGLVHISQICDKYIKHPSEVLSVGDIVNVKILGVDLNKKRISLTMKGL